MKPVNNLSRSYFSLHVFHDNEERVPPTCKQHDAKEKFLVVVAKEKKNSGSTKNKITIIILF